MYICSPSFNIIPKRMIRLTGITIAMMICILSVSFGQEEPGKNYISKGQWLIGGNLSLYTTDDFDDFTFSFSPSGGYLITNKLALGLRTSFSNTRIVDVDGENLGRHNAVSLAPFARYYVSVNRFAPFAEVSYGGAWHKMESNFSGTPTTSKDNSTFYSAGVGANYFLSKNVALEGALIYSKTIDSYYDGTVGFDLGLQFFLSRNNSSTAEEENYISKGQWLIGGTGNISLGEVDALDFNQFSVTPMAGYLVGNKLAVGLSTGFNYYKGGSQSFYAQPFVRYYVNQKRLTPFGEIAYGAAWTKIKYYDFNINDTVVDTYSSTAYRISAGLNYFLTRNIALEGKLNYSNNPDTNSGSLGLQAGLQFFIR